MQSTGCQLGEKELVLSGERVVRLGELLGSADQVAYHYFGARPRQQLVDALPAVLEKEGQVVAQSE